MSPEYDYQCPKCGEKFTMLCKMQDHESEPDCPKCGTPCEQTWEDGRAPHWSFRL
jgi:putative FmdB family regulatory protein